MKKLTKEKIASMIRRINLRCKCTEKGCVLFDGLAGSKVTPKMDSISARKVVYEHAIGKTPDGKRITTTCGEGACLNPKHLRATSTSEIVRRGTTAETRQKRSISQSAYAEKRSRAPNDLVEQIRADNTKSASQWAIESGMSHDWVSKVKLGRLRANTRTKAAEINPTTEGETIIRIIRPAGSWESRSIAAQAAPWCELIRIVG